MMKNCGHGPVTARGPVFDLFIYSYFYITNLQLILSILHYTAMYVRIKAYGVGLSLPLRHDVYVCTYLCILLISSKDNNSATKS